MIVVTDDGAEIEGNPNEKPDDSEQNNGDKENPDEADGEDSIKDGGSEGGEVEENYIFTAVLSKGYALAEGVSLPKITVTVKDADISTQALLERIAALPELEEYLALELIKRTKALIENRERAALWLRMGRFVMN